MPNFPFYRCKEIKDGASLLDTSPSCTLSNKIVQEGDFFVANELELADTCNANADRTCVEEAFHIISGSTDYGCTINFSDIPIFYNLQNFKEDFNAITNFACNKSDCYTVLRNYQMGYLSLQSLSCECMEDTVSIVGSLTPNSKQNFLKLDPFVFNQIQDEVNKCRCNALNNYAASFQQEGYCSLHDAILKGKYIFAGDSTAIESTCAEPLSCVGNITEAVAQINMAENCELKQKTNYLAKFLYSLNNSTDFKSATQFICNNFESDTAGCFHEVKASVESCKSDDATSDCAKSVSSDCMEAFLNMVGRLSDDWKDDILSIESEIIQMMKPNEAPTKSNGATDTNSTLSGTTDEALLSNDPTQMNDGTQSNDTPSQSVVSSASFYGTFSIISCMSPFALALKLLR